MVAGDDNGPCDLFVHARVTRETILVSTAPGIEERSSSIFVWRGREEWRVTS